VRIARNLNADIVVLHVYTNLSPAPDAQEAFDIFAEAAADSGLSVQSRIQRGPVVETIVSVAEDGDFALIIMGASVGVLVKEWISSQVLHTSQLPVVVIPHALPLKGNT
jgi:nucleotide-binding universal stress UspA family protein